MVTHAQAWDSARQRRISYLAQPKVNHQIVCNRETANIWQWLDGQQMPVDGSQNGESGALEAIPGSSMDFLCDLVISVYWTDKLPSKTHKFTVPVLTPRQEELSRAKKICQGFEENRPVPIWPVRAASKHATASPRVRDLAHPKLVSSAWEADRHVYTRVSKGAMTAAARERTIHLAKPKKRDFSAKLDRPLTPPRSITQLVRTQFLARPKTEHPSYLHDKPVQWLVSAGAKNAVMSARLSELTRPKVRKEIFEGYDPYRVSSAARRAEASARLQELSVPLRVRKKRS